MNYYITHCDKNYLTYAERLFDTLSIFSNNKIIFYTVDFDYISKYKNVIPKKITTDDRRSKLDLTLNNNDVSKVHNVFLKPLIVKDVLQNFTAKDNFCYLDADCLAIKNCDKIFDKLKDITEYPLFNKGCHDYMIFNGRGDPFINGKCDLSLTLEANLLKYLKFDLNNRKQYLQTGVFLFNNKCSDFIKSWSDICDDMTIINNWKIFAPFHEETVVNCLLWQKYNSINDLKQSLINLPYNTYDLGKSFDKISEMLSCLEDLKNEDYFIDIFCRIPSKENSKNLFFYHGKISDNEYNYVKNYMTNRFLLKINSQSLGDTLAATPTLRKLYNSYNRKIDVVTYHPELFIRNKYVNKVFKFGTILEEKSYSEIFNTFLGVGGKKNDYGVEKKHNTIDIRQYHALDLGFMLNEKEMEYDYIANNYLEIENLPSEYICLHVANTWPSRTYSDENWQTLINLINSKNIAVVLIGKNSHETGFYNVDKPTKKLNFIIGLDLTNKLDISQCWHVINKAKYFITMDSGLLHLAGTTDTHIIQLGSSINNKLRAPYRKNSQEYKYTYIGGSCDIFCASDIKYGVKEWKTIQGVPPLITCLENKTSYECHPNPQLIYNFIFSQYKNNKKFLFITGHLSTGGSPKYLEWLISKKIEEGFDVKVIEWNLYSDTYVIQRNIIINLVGSENFISVGYYGESDEVFYPKIKQIIDKIKEYNPDYIHLNEFSENFAIKKFSKEMIDFLYDKNRKFKLYETTHSAQSDIANKINIPDQLWSVSKYHHDIAINSKLNSIIMEMEIPNKNRPNREKTLRSLDLDPSYVHVLQVGLFNKNKNQKFTFDLAKKFLNKKIQFHFIGNHCFIDECEIDKNQINCKIWGERSDVDVFMSCMDVFIMPSLEELNPIALKEALSWNMHCFISELSTIKDKYIDNKNVTFIKNSNVELYLLSKIYETININTKNFNLSDVEEEQNRIICTFYPVPKLEILGDFKYDYEIKFVDKKTNFEHYKTTISTNMWTMCSIVYFCDWKITVTNKKTGYQKIFDFDLKNKNVRIINDSGSLGDSIAWMAAVDKFQKLHNCKVDYFTVKKELFKSEYPNINFYNYADSHSNNYYTEYKIGCFNRTTQSHMAPSDWRISNLQKMAFEILGIEYSETKSKVTIPNKYKIKYDKYVCIATQSTSQSRYWNYNNGWTKVVDYLKSKNYKIICVDKYSDFGSAGYLNSCPKNVDYFAGEHSFDEIIDIINGCEFFIGLSSGLSWLAWALNKKIIKINGSVKPSFEFKTEYTVHNNSVCNACFNSVKHKFDPSNWAWCPENKNFECTKNITEIDVIDKIEKLIKNESIQVNKKIKLVHIQTTINSDNEKKSKSFIEKFEKYGIKYVNHKNHLCDNEEYLKNCLYPDLLHSNGPDKLTSRHYGCFDSHKKAVLKEFTEDVDFLIVCEGDCLFEKSHTEFIALLNNITNTCENNDIGYFSFGDIKTLDKGIVQSNIKTIPKNQNECFITDKIIGTQCIMFNKNIKNKLMNEFSLNQSWYIIDGWLNEFCWKNNINMGILFQRATNQYSGESFINRTNRNFNN